jgi:hypothetical protein
MRTSTPGRAWPTRTCLELGEGLREQRGRARDEEAHIRASLAGEARMRQQADVEGGHAHHHRRIRHLAHHLVHVEAGQEDHLAAVQEGAVERDEEPVDVKDRQSVEQHVARHEAPQLVQRARVALQIAVAQHRPLGAAGGARGVADGRDVVGADRRDLVRWLELG